MMKKILSISGLLFVALYFGQTNLTSTENYVYTKTCLNEDCTKVSENVQYLDGWGKPVQTIHIKATPQGKDIVLPIEYDQFGRQVKNYLPIPQNTSQNGAIFTAPLTSAGNVYGSEKIYAEAILENSPISRALQQIPVGNDWANKPVNLNYDANTDGEVTQYTVSTSWFEERTQYILTNSGSYGISTLAKNTVTDEDGNVSIEFKNKKGQTVLARRKDGDQNVDTYYVYNEFGQLAYVIPPLASKSGAVDQATLDNLCYQYYYDGWNRLVEKKIPGKGWEYMVYDKQNRLVATQDAELRKNNYWLYTKYDVWGRVALTGMSTGYGNSRISEQNLADALGQNNVGRTTQVSYNRQGIDVYYDNFNGSYPDSSRWITLLSVNYYDSYPGYPFNPPFPASIQGKTVLTETPGTDGKSTKGLPVLSLIKNIEDDNWTKNYVYYDDQGRAIGHYSINHLGGYTKTESKLDFAGLTQTSVVRHKRVDTDPERLITQNFEFDGQNRLLVHKHQIDSKPVEILAQNKYNELSQLESKKIGGTHIAAPLQTIEYQYNIQGSLTKVNNPADLNGKLFGYELKYQNPVYSNISPGKYSGNIMEMDWKDASENVLKRYTYSYDGLNRLKDAVYTEPNATNPYNNNYNESLIYDSNGNIKSLKRNAFPVMGTTSTLVDDLDYRYTGNLLTQVIENSLNDTGYEGGNNKIDYDLNGNMINMKDKGIYNIIYNFLNLPDSYSITQKDPLGATKTFGLEYLYSANGTKLRKIYTSSAGGRGQATTRNTTDYLDGFQYSISEIIQACDWCRTSVAFEQEAYKNAGIGIGIGGPETVTPEWVLNFVPTAEGFYNFTENRYIYQYKDHLGNARVSFTQNSAGALEITDTNSYYPLGLNHIGGNKGVLGSYQNYKYNGKELQETGMFDYGWRHYMPDLGRWTGMDQLSEKYYPTSPFAYADNNPIMIIDPDGRLNMHLINGFLSNSQSDVTWYNTGGGFSSTAGASVDYDGNTINWSHGYTTSILANVGVNLEYVNIPSIELKGSSFFWALKIQQHVNSYMERWNAKSDFEWDRMKIVARLNDHGVNYVGGAGDPIGIFDVVGQVMSTWKPENRYLAMAAGIIGAVALKKPGLAGAESKAVVNLTEETFSQALMKGAENVGGYSIYGTKGLVGNTFNRNIFLLEASGSKSLSGLRSLVGNMEKEALGTGANKISIYGSSVINKGFLNPNIAARFGYTFEQLGNGVVLQKTLK